MRIFYLLILLCCFGSFLSAQRIYPRTDGKGRWGYCDEKGNWIVRPSSKYDQLTSYSDGMAQVMIGKKWGYFDTSGRCVIPCRYQECGPFKEGRAYVSEGERYGFINVKGQLVIPYRYVKAENFSCGRALVSIPDKDGRSLYGYIDSNGKEKIPFIYDRAYSFEEGLAYVFTRGEGWVVDTSGKVWFGPFGEDPYSTQIFFAKALAVELGMDKVHPSWVKAGNVYLDEPDFRSKVEEKRKSSELEKPLDLLEEENPNPVFIDFAKAFVEERMNSWQRKGEFEKLEAYRVRMSDSSRDRQIAVFFQQAQDAYISQKLKDKPLDFSLSDYDSENEVFLVEEGVWGPFLVPVPIGEARLFKDEWNRIEIRPSFSLNGTEPVVSSIDFRLPGGKTFHYHDSARLDYVSMDMDYFFEPVSIPSDLAFQGQSRSGHQVISSRKLTVGKSDVDVDIPVTHVTDSLTFVIIIANENYLRLNPVPYALNDGYVFGEYCKKTWGIPQENIRFYEDATYGTMLMAVKDIQDIAAAFGGEMDLLFYYAGHGAPQGSGADAYLLPVDAYGVDEDISYSLSRLYRELGEIPARSVTVFLDACFSGSTRGGDMLASARSVAIKPQISAPSGNTVVFSAASGDETAMPYPEKQHGLFTYYLLKKIQQTQGNVTYKELADYVVEQVSRRSLVLHRKTQVPNMMASPSLSQDWKTLPLNGKGR